jgi:hypothetical protein
MATLTVDFFTSLDGNGSARGWPGYWGKDGLGSLTPQLASLNRRRTSPAARGPSCQQPARRLRGRLHLGYGGGGQVAPSSDER